MQVFIVPKLIQAKVVLHWALPLSQSQFVNRSVLLCVSCLDSHFSDKAVISGIGACNMRQFAFASFVFGIQLQYKITGLDVILVTGVWWSTSSNPSRNQWLCFVCFWVIVTDWFFPLVLAVVVDCSSLEEGHLEWSVGPPRYPRNEPGYSGHLLTIKVTSDKKCSPLFPGVGLVLASGFKYLSDWLT